MKDLSDQRGLYVPEMEKDSCGTGLIAQLNGTKSHQLIEDALLMLSNMEHRGACGCEPNTGDGAGILIQLPDLFFRNWWKSQGIILPEFGKYAVGFLFLPKDPAAQQYSKAIFESCIEEMNMEVIGYRPVPTNPEGLGKSALAVEPYMEQIFLRSKENLEPKVFERKLLVLRKYGTHQVHNAEPELKDFFYLCSLSYKTIVYKGQLTTHQLSTYYPDLHHPDVVSAIALIHSRFSTNTFPKWKLAQPFRYIAHNGEINTITGNLNWWKARESLLESSFFSSEDLEKMLPI
ncbi:MAG: glutamate synthase subunit alpha, partial [Saprospiraceae bacterium]|nr:glutamate synthase subunit alpha [Saprospiraceae bacterium]